MQDCKDPDILILTTTVGSEADAERLARGLLGARLAACVQVEALRSFYRWEGQDCDEAEWRLTIKSVPARQPEIEAWLAAHHPYELPQLAAWCAGASAGYGEWVRGELLKPAAPARTPAR